jgi:hypothetical protein
MTILLSSTLLDSKLSVAWQVLARFLVDSKQLSLEAFEFELVNVYLESSYRCEKYAEPLQRSYSNSAGCGWQKINHDAIMPELVSSLPRG